MNKAMYVILRALQVSNSSHVYSVSGYSRRLGEPLGLVDVENRLMELIATGLVKKDRNRKSDNPRRPHRYSLTPAGKEAVETERKLHEKLARPFDDE